MGHWLLYLLVFIFGYVTCRTFYFVRSARLSLTVVKTAQLIYLSAMTKAIENMLYARGIVLEHMLKTEKSSNQISIFELNFNQDIEAMKERSIKLLKVYHPSFFESMLEFDDWPSAMVYLNTHKDEVFKFWEKLDDRQD